MLPQLCRIVEAVTTLLSLIPTSWMVLCRENFEPAQNFISSDCPSPSTIKRNRQCLHLKWDRWDDIDRIAILPTYSTLQYSRTSCGGTCIDYSENFSTEQVLTYSSVTGRLKFFVPSNIKPTSTALLQYHPLSFKLVSYFTPRYTLRHDCDLCLYFFFFGTWCTFSFFFL